ncbi:MAG TPA: hypothetical protein VD886_21465, partial [Herpetosiphonaceae bacterium]|nr:hypothetical protein [Herpetosiphonaceae bacterium]
FTMARYAITSPVASESQEQGQRKTRSHRRTNILHAPGPADARRPLPHTDRGSRRARDPR